MGVLSAVEHIFNETAMHARGQASNRLAMARSSEVMLRYLWCILDFFPTPLSPLSTLSLVLDAASAAKELAARPS